MGCKCAPIEFLNIPGSLDHILSVTEVLLNFRFYEFYSRVIVYLMPLDLHYCKSISEILDCLR